MKFRDRTVLVTGASRGIGAAIARAFAAEGATVVVNYLRNAEAAEWVAAECRSLGGDGWALQADVTDDGAVRAMADRLSDELGRLDAIVNNAFRPYAFDPEKRALFWDLEWGDYRSQVDGALKGTFTVCRAMLPLLRRRPGGSIVNMATDLVARPTVPYHDYATAKSALVGFSRNLAAELGPLGIRVNCVAPGLVYPTDASRSTREDVKDRIIAQTPLRRIATPEDMAGPVLFLASDWSRFMTGQTLYVDGGLVMG
ncbi:SDR family oxidoreductase [Azospirillum picis]|uniref:3-oxoacyl-[acyl-carrier protein] reductase n=1 Tax=Azospirillum picis TaxID=488438 RepID=A0ABU0MPJ4_9PROT|nr:SDR family oxidoreductase [Azospirillum picis]MBP2301759.1 3-oxoacyl-[acyl-carrier protein] reductase [Azospirillum picis]MDQ0535066.1 3-oxoacyl-[acyl-carrier protein] reductase [Azospirillum picis]